MLDYTSVPIPLRIIGIQQRTTLDKAHETLGEMWQQWEGNHKANRLPSFTMTIYCVYQTWGKIEDNSSLKRTFTTDFETYMLDGLPRIYVGVEPPEAA